MNLVIDHIMIHLNDPIRLNTLSRVAKLSPFHFHRIFQAVLGETPAEFVKRLRLDRAVGLLAQSPKSSLTSIALECGFSSSSDFSRCFKQRFKVAPSALDIESWKKTHGNTLQLRVDNRSRKEGLKSFPRRNPDKFHVKIRDIPSRSVAYIRVAKPYEGGAVISAAQRLVNWAQQSGFAENQWLGYQWENPEITPLEKCRYHVAVEAQGFRHQGEVGQFHFPAMIVAEVEVRGGIDLELRALQWLYGTWLPRSGYVPDDYPCFESWIGRPFATGTDHFQLHIQLPVRRAGGQYGRGSRSNDKR